MKPVSFVQIHMPQLFSLQDHFPPFAANNSPIYHNAEGNYYIKGQFSIESGQIKPAFTDFRFIKVFDKDASKLLEDNAFNVEVLADKSYEVSIIGWNGSGNYPKPLRGWQTIQHSLISFISIPKGYTNIAFEINFTSQPKSITNIVIKPYYSYVFLSNIYQGNVS